MAHPLDGVEAKLTRAEAHLDAVKQAIEGITSRDADLITGEFDREEGRYLFRAPRDSAEGAWLSPIIGDCVHNFRTALDYLAWELSSPSYRAAHGRMIEFPIFADPDEYAAPRGAAKKVGGIDPKVQTIIKCLQPFNGPDCRPDFSLAHPTENPLWHLSELDNWDKHRSLNLTQDVASMKLIGFDRLGIVMPPDPFRLGGPFKRAAPFVFASIGQGNPEMNVYLEATFDVAFDQNGPESVGAEPVLKTLDDIRKEIRFRVLPRLRRFLLSK